MAVGTVLALLMSIGSSTVLADEAETYSEVKVERRSTELFDVSIPGETYDELTGAIGHRTVDMTLSGNGPLSYQAVRQYEEQPEGYSYAFGTMSLATPTLTIDTEMPNNAAVNSVNFQCGQWISEPIGSVRTVHQVFEAIGFTHESGSTKLLSRDLLSDSFRNRFPAEAKYMSKDFYWMRCEGPRFVVTAPDGVEYVFSAVYDSGQDYGLYNQGAAERTLQYRVRQSGSYRHIMKYNVFRLPVVEKRRLNARLQYFHQLATVPAPGSSAGAPIVVPDRYYTYRTTYRTDYKELFDRTIEHKMRLKRVQLVVPGEPSRNLHYSYRSASQACPSMISAIESDASPEKRVTYEYVGNGTLASGEYRPNGLSPLGCALSKVRRADGSTWEFKYGLNDNPSFRIGSDMNAATSSSLVMFKDDLITTTTPRRTQQGSYQQTTENLVTWTPYLPIRSVKIPTGATVRYGYRALGLCEYQDSERRTPGVWYNRQSYDGIDSCRWGISTSASRRPAVTTRHVMGPVTTGSYVKIAYRKNPASYQVERWISYSKSTTRLVLGRVDRLSYPREVDSSVEGAQLRDSGRVAAAYLYPGFVLPPPSGDPEAAPVAKVTYRYETLMPEVGAPLERGWWEHAWARETGGCCYNRYPWWTQVNARNSWRFDARRVVLVEKRTVLDGAISTTAYSAYDDYDNPRRIVESQRIGNTVTSRTTNQSYRNTNASSSGPWVIGAPAVTRTNSGDRAPGGALAERYTNRWYNSDGLPSYVFDDGVATWFWYNADGTLRTLKHGTVVTRYSDYTHGIARRETIDGVSDKVTRGVTAFGAVAWEQTADGARTTYEYRASDNALVKRTPPAPLAPVKITPPDWRNGGGEAIETVDGVRKWTIEYDALGREVSDLTLDLAYGGATTLVRTAYDVQGHVSSRSDPSSGSLYGAPRMMYTYDALGRPLVAKHTGEAEGVTRCYGPSCAGQAGFSGLAATANSVMVRDQAGYLASYEFRTLGSPVNAELMKTRHEIRKYGEARRPHETGTRVVETTIRRNLVGFVKSMSQGTSTRIWNLRFMGNWSTTQIEAQYDVERGWRTTLSFDLNGRPESVREPDGSVYDYTYDSAGRSRTVTQRSRESGAAEVAGPITYEYDAAGRKDVIDQGGVRRQYYFNKAGLLASESLQMDGTSFGFVYGFDELGSITSIRYPSLRTVSMKRDAFGRARSITGFVDDVEYHPNGTLESYRLSNGTTFSLNLDSRQRPWKREIQNARGHRFVDSTTTYDARNNVTRITKHFAPTSSWLFGGQYDGLSRLVSIGGLWGTARYGYDSLGNLGGYSLPGYSLDYDYNLSRKLVSTTASGSSWRARSQGTRAVTHDGLGNVSSHGDASYRFDGQSRLLEVQRDDFVQQNRYDGAGIRVESKVTESVPGSEPRTSTTRYFYTRSGALLHERELESGEFRDHVQLDGRTIATIGRHTGHDSDGDSMPDYFERLHGLNVHRPDADRDRDGDGLSNLHEYFAGTSPTRTDSDFDGVPDAEEEDAVDVPAYKLRPDSQPVFDYLMSM